MGDQIIVRIIPLNGGKEIQPSAEIFSEGRLLWVKDLLSMLLC